MKDVFLLVSRLEKLRKIPQFIFIGPIYPPQTARVRDEILRYSKKNPSIKEIDLILESPGGSADDAYRMIRTIRHSFEKVNIVVPFWAKSAATLLALGGSTIIMDEFGEFGPLDTQLKTDDEMPDSEPESALIDEYSLSTIEDRAQELYQRMLLSLLKSNEDSEIDVRIKKTILSEQLLNYIPNLYKPLLDKINPYEIGAKARYLSVGEKYAERILNEFNKPNLGKDIRYFIDYIVHECPDHGYIIDYSVISKFLKNIKHAKEIGVDYCNILTELSNLFFRNKVKDYYIGFFDKDLLALNKEAKDKKKKVENEK